MRKTGMMLAGVWSFCVFCVQGPWILRVVISAVHSMREELQQVGELVSEHERELDAGVRVQLEKMGSVKLRLSEHTEALNEIKRQQVEMSKVLEHCAKNAADADLVDTVEKLKLTATDLYARLETLDKWSTEKLQKLDGELTELVAMEAAKSGAHLTD